MKKRDLTIVKIVKQVFFVKNALNKHIFVVHKGKRIYNCQSCNASFRLKGTLKKHISVVHEKKRHYKCQSCETSFLLRSHLNRHISAVHERKITHMPYL